ncbi:MAG: aminoacyl-tRNA deacylase [Candidatus Nanopusillus sp.]|jgi:prolyl-tRNA editing enzyme YbaK/EbsC (Cys-tRNA(Pro) deacylase)
MEKYLLDEKYLENYLNKLGISFQIIKYEKPVMSAKNTEEHTDGIVAKSIILICDNKPLLCFLLGKDIIDLDKIKKYFNCNEVRLAKAKEVKEITGYDIGGVPPIGLKQKIKTIVDKKIIKLDDDQIIYCGGGSHYHLLRISKKDLLKIMEYEVYNITV